MVIKNLENVGDRATGEIHLVIGILDGVHLGHQVLVNEAVKAAKKSGGTAALLTFCPHPSRLFTPKAPVLLIMSLGIKHWFLKKRGIDIFIEQDFNWDFAELEAQEFTELLKDSLPNLASVYVGDNFRFGHRRKGDVNFLKAEGSRLEFEVFTAKRKEHKGEVISSSRIRSALKQGEMEKVNTMLGYPYFSIEGIITGTKIGTEIGYPTINMPWRPECKPRYGVYAVKLKDPNSGKRLPGVANYGVRPTRTEDIEPTLEVHLIEMDGSGISGDITVEWHHCIRPEMPFKSKEELRKQIGLDVEATREYFKG